MSINEPAADIVSNVRLKCKYFNVEEQVSKYLGINTILVDW